MALANDVKTPSVGQCIAVLRRRSTRILEICDMLEVLADDLPKQQAPVFREAQRQSQLALKPHYGLLSQHVLPTLLARTEGEDERQDLLLKLHADCLNRVETVEALDDLFDDVLTSNRFDIEPEALGFALRGFFECFRNDAAWQLDVLWPLSLRVLTDEDAAHIGLMDQAFAHSA